MVTVGVLYELVGVKKETSQSCYLERFLVKINKEYE
jgi:hypothetical protein